MVRRLKNSRCVGKVGAPRAQEASAGGWAGVGSERKELMWEERKGFPGLGDSRTEQGNRGVLLKPTDLLKIVCSATPAGRRRNRHCALKWATANGTFLSGFKISFFKDHMNFAFAPVSQDLSWGLEHSR